ncbi:hypothetical protein CH333_01055 [candidate division WOR-3 bacterium JGI_Cruoil_03_44_89]|uniref:Fibronectin type-III domain-containing protein n=1 Tax=candidate division WOR-3 bacterium JGI_Cruoil_03_44_89 TaxID=1973748 RepID=A0A235BYU9_UNCW3|nr:MAG: hypothetical protein CH333_01055 [candidate division WOR-3 bacterium JGI_Cruoil_03_44_89]
MVFFFVLFFIPSVLLQSITNLTAFDTPNDAGGSITITWNVATELQTGGIVRYEIFRSKSASGGYENIGIALSNKTKYVDTSARDGMDYYYYVVAVSKEGETGKSGIFGPVSSTLQWFNTKRWNVLVILVFLIFAFFFYINLARKGIKTFIRKIPGLEALDDAVGRSTEMGKPILYIPGLWGLTNVTVLASLSILRRVAKKTAEYGARIMIPNANPLVMTATQEVVKEAYLEAGRPDLYNEKDIFFLTGDQFGYAAGCDGIIVREKPGAIFLLGVFAAESLILAETGNSIGAIQISGTTSTLQLPFFVASCDYTLIGEEMLAAASYLSGEPVMLGSLKGEDLAKIVMILLIIVGALLTTFGVVDITGLFSTG